MKTKSDPTIAVNSITGKTIKEMTWDELRSISKPITREEMIRRAKEAVPPDQKSV